MSNCCINGHVRFFCCNRWKPVLGVIYLALKICLLLFLEAGIFPLLCGWWIDICAFVSSLVIDSAITAV